MSLSPLAAALDLCQRTQHSHKKAAESLKSMIVAHSEAAGSVDGFVQEFVSHLSRVLVVLKREPAVERLLEFMCKFAANNEVVAVAVLKYAVTVHNAKDKAVRFRACQIIANLLKHLDEGTEIEDELWQDLQAALLMRARDKIAAVRVEAAKALTRLQMPEDEACPVVTEMLRLMNTDSCSSVREAALECVCISKTTLPQILARMRDSALCVRQAARQKMVRVVQAGTDDADLNSSDSIDNSVVESVC